MLSVHSRGSEITRRSEEEAGTRPHDRYAIETSPSTCPGAAGATKAEMQAVALASLERRQQLSRSSWRAIGSYPARLGNERGTYRSDGCPARHYLSYLGG
jgi:hypothetical protein